MLPKLQQSSLANTLRRDNLASQIQCTPALTQARTSFVAFSASKTTRATSPGKTNTHRRTRTPPSETSPRSTSPRKKSKNQSMNPNTNSPSPAHSPNTQNLKELEAASPAPSKKRRPSKNPSPNPAPSRKEKCLSLSSEGTTIAATSPSVWTTKTPCPSWSGRFPWNPWTTITTFPFSSTEPDRNSTPIVPLRLWAPTTCWTRAATRSFPSFPNSSSPSKVKIPPFSRPQHPRPRDHRNHAQDNPKIGAFGRDDRVGNGPILPSNSADFQHLPQQ